MSKKKNNDMSQILAKLDKLDDRLDSVDKTLVKQEANLGEHMRRTALLEEDLKPIKKHVGHVEGGLKLLGILSLILGILFSIGKLTGML